jgi:hydroxymethylglutaryl-CoA lyase
VARALDAGVHRIVVPISVSEAHSVANVRKTPADMIAAFAEMCALSQGRAELIAGLSTVFGCTLQGEVRYDDVANIAQQAVQAGADAIALGDTTGHATPQQVGEIISLVRGVAGNKLRSLHFHDTRGLALANTLIALQHGIREFDASLAGLGGCPHAPGATGNVNTEDLVFMLESMGYDTGIDLVKLLATRDVLAQSLPGEPLYGYLARAGIPKQFSAQRKS